MSWNECLYQYHKKYGGQLLAGGSDDGLLVFTWRDRPLAVDLSAVGGARGGTFRYVRARIPVALDKPYSLTIGPKKLLSGGVNAVLRAVPSLPETGLLPSDFGFPEITRQRLIRSDNYDFTKLVLGSLDLRSALLACPEDRVKVRPGPGEESLITVSTASPVSGGIFDDNGDWSLSDVTDTAGQRVAGSAAQQAELAFFPRLDRFLNLARTAYDALTQWRM